MIKGRLYESYQKLGKNIEKFNGYDNFEIKIRYLKEDKL